MKFLLTNWYWDMLIEITRHNALPEDLTRHNALSDTKIQEH